LEDLILRFKSLNKILTKKYSQYCKNLKSLQEKITLKFKTSLHLIHFKKGTVLLTLALLPAFSGLLGYDDFSVVANVKTDIILTADSQTSRITTTKPTIAEAFQEKNITLGKFDITEPELDTKLFGGTLNVTLEKAHRVLVTETLFSGDTKQYEIESGYEKPEKILAHNKIEISSYDKISSDLNLDFSQKEFLGQIITIKRAARVNLIADGTVKKVETWEGDVSHFLTERGIILGSDDKVEPSPEAKITDGISVKVIRVFKDEMKEKAIIARPVIYQRDPNLLEGVIQVISAGKDGQKEQTFGITYENGTEVARVLLSEVVLVPAESKVVVQGTKPQNPNGYWDIITKASEQYGVDGAKMYRVMMCESGGRANAVGAGFYGLFQYVPSTWANASVGAGYAGASIYNPEAQIYVTAWKVAVSGWGAWPVCGRL